MSDGEIPHGSIIGRRSSMVAVPNYNYYDHAPKGQRESDRAYFENKHAGTRRDDRLEQKRQSRRTSDRKRAEALREEEHALTEKYKAIRESRNGHRLTPEHRQLISDLVAIKDDDGEQKWTFAAIGRIVGMSGTAVKEIAIPEYGHMRNAYKSGKTPEQIEREQKREQAMRMLELGIAQKDIAESVGVGPTTVSYWSRKVAA